MTKSIALRTLRLGLTCSSPKHLQSYLDEFAFRFNRRRSRHVGKIFHRLAEQLFLRQGQTYQQIIAD